MREWASKTSAYMTMFAEVKAQLEGKPAWTWAESVQKDLLAQKETMVGIHNQFVSVTQKVPADQTPLSDVREYDDMCKEIEKKSASSMSRLRRPWKLLTICFATRKESFPASLLLWKTQRDPGTQSKAEASESGKAIN